MGNTSSCCFTQPNTNSTLTPAEDGSQPVVRSHSDQPALPPAPSIEDIQPNDNPESSSAPSIESIQKIIQEEHTTDHIDNLINVLSIMTGDGEEGPMPSTVDRLAFTTRSAAQVVDFFSKEAENIKNMEIISQGLGRAATSVLNAIGGAHFLFLGLSLVAYTAETYMKMKSNDSACKELLVTLLELAKDLKDFQEAVTGETDKVRKAIHEILVGAVNCRLYMARASASRYLSAAVMESHLEETKETMKDLRASLNFAANMRIARGVSTIRRNIPKHSVPCPLEPLLFQPEGIEDQVADVKEKLDIQGSEQAKAVVIVGIGGIGKSTLAASVIASLNLSDFKYSMVTVDEKTPDKNSHIVKLQSDIIFHFTEDVQYLKDAKEGREKLEAAMANKSCFLHIDNVVDSYFIKELLPTEFLPQKSEKKCEAQKSEKKSESKNSRENSEKQMQKTKIRMLITSREKDLKPLLKINMVEHEMGELSGDAPKNFLRRTILEGDNPAQDFHEDRKIEELAAACGGLPLLLSVFGNHLKENRDKCSYEEAIKALKEGNIDRYKTGDEELVSEKLMFVYDRMKDEEAQEAFLDICTYFYGHPWDLVAHIVDTATIATLHNKRLVIKSEAGKVIVHGILRLMGIKKAKNTRVMNYDEFFNINDDDSKLRSVKGMVLLDRTFLAKLETRHLNAMRHSLRFLVLGDWVGVEGPPCERAFNNLRYLQLGDLNVFPFKNVSKMEKLNVFENSSKSAMALIQLPQSLKHLTHDIHHPDCDEFASLPLKNLKSLKQFTVVSKTSVRLPQGFKLPGSLEHLRLNICEQLPETFGHLPALQTLSLDYCDLKCLPHGFTQCVQLRSLSLQHCTSIISLPENAFASLCSLRDLNLEGCSRLENLPSDLGTLTALQHLNINECQTLRLLPENFGGLKTLKTLSLDGCTSLQRLPDSFGMLCIERLALEYLDSLKELPQNMGDLSRLQNLTIRSCPSLESLPDSFVRLTKLDNLEVENCSKLAALPKNFDQLRCLKTIYLSRCPRLTRLPEGFERLRTLKSMELRDCSSLVDLPASFEMLLCLEELYLSNLAFSRLPDGLGKLKRLRTSECSKFQTWPQDLEHLAALESLRLVYCPMLEGTTMDKILKLQNCHDVDIRWSIELINRWNELKEENKNLPMMVWTSHMMIGTSWRTYEDEYREELDRARRVGLLCGKCIQLKRPGMELIPHSSLPIPNKTTIALISLPLDQPQLLQLIVDMAIKRATSNCAGQLTILYACRRSREEENEKIQQALTMLPQEISYAIPSTDIRRLSLIGLTVFGNPDVFNDGTGPKLLCFMVDVREDDEGHQILKYGKCVTEDEISRKSGEKLPVDEISDEEIEISDGIVEFLNFICGSETESPSEQCSRLPEENMAGELIQKLKNDNIHHFSDSKVKVDHLQGKTVAIILIDRNYKEFARLQQIYLDIKFKQPNFEAIWIPLMENQDFGFGTYARAIQGMPWLTLPDPKLIKVDAIKDKSPRVIIINSGGSIRNRNALLLLMSWGAYSYPFTKECLGQLNLKWTLEILFHSMGINEELNNKLIFLYAESPDQNLKMKCSLEKLVQIHGKGKFEIVYVGRFSDGSKVEEGFQKKYEDVTQTMNWMKLSFWDMMTFWYRCNYLSDKEVHRPNSASTLIRVVKALLNEERLLVVVDGAGMVTAHGIDIVEMACLSTDEKNDEVDIMMKELRQSLGEGKCGEAVRRYFLDEINHPQHAHALRIQWREREFGWECDSYWRKWSFCCRMCSKRDYTPYGRRIYRCTYCKWDLCWDCWKEFVEEEVTQKS